MSRYRGKEVYTIPQRTVSQKRFSQGGMDIEQITLPQDWLFPMDLIEKSHMWKQRSGMSRTDIYALINRKHLVSGGPISHS